MTRKLSNKQKISIFGLTVVIVFVVIILVSILFSGLVSKNDTSKSTNGSNTTASTSPTAIIPTITIDQSSQNKINNAAQIKTITGNAANVSKFPVRSSVVSVDISSDKDTPKVLVLTCLSVSTIKASVDEQKKRITDALNAADVSDKNTIEYGIDESC